MHLDNSKGLQIFGRTLGSCECMKLGLGHFEKSLKSSTTLNPKP